MFRVEQNTAAILFSGGDAPGMNALLRVFVRLGHKRYGASILGIKDGYAGLVRTCQRLASKELDDRTLRSQIADHVGRAGISDGLQDIVLMDDRSVSGIIDRGGIILGSARCEEFQEERVRIQAVRLLKKLDVGAVVVVGGEGSLAGAADLARESSLRIIGIPCTIDNDYPLSELSLGADTAVNTVVSCVRRVNDTARSHHRVMVLEIMGRDSGHLAETAALASGAEIVVTPERGRVTAAKMRRIAQRIEELMLHGRMHAVILVAEGAKLAKPSAAGPTKALADSLNCYFQGSGKLDRHVDIRYSVLGHLQRGGAPSATDRLLAADFAEAAWQALAARRRRSGVLGLVHGRIRLQDYDAAPRTNRAAHMQRIYDLQKDVSKPSSGRLAD